MFCDFKTKTFAKWILAGEHAVVRGNEALVFPIPDKQLIFTYNANVSSLSADYTGSHGPQMHLLFWSVLEQGIQLLGGSVNQLYGHFHLDSNIPIGVGLGASAALCVAMSRWYCAQQMIDASYCHEFAKNLEHLFHGTSSGLDIAGVSSEKGVYFKAGTCLPVNQIFYPNWYLSSCNQIGVTSDCIGQVQQLWKKDAQLAEKIDKQMVEAVHEAKQALEYEDTQAQAHLAKAINKARDCFMQWGLISESLQQHINQLLKAGASAVKPTGSGGGGYVLSLWNQAPDSSSIELTRI
ncbi:MAG: mevalonate kinase [Legionella sp.]|nr:mevalonate kinase [Legionella sp.]